MWETVPMSFKKLGATVAFIMVAFPLCASALTSEELRAQITALLAQIATLQQQLDAQGGGATTQGTSSACPRLTQNLRYGAQGDEVMELQQFLYDEGLLDESAMVGFYGMNTQRAVQEWQRAHNVISSGTPDTTGYGAVGPRTRSAIASACARRTTTPGTTNPNTCPTYPPISCPAGQKAQEQPLNTQGCRPQAQCVQDVVISFRGAPTSGPSPLSVTFTLANANPSGTYTINFGDGSSAAFPAGSSATQYHTYTAQGTFTATLSEQLVCSAGVCTDTPRAAGSVTVSVQRPAVVALATVAIGNASGTAPLATQFVLSGANRERAYVVDYGDGEFGVFTLNGTSGSLTHVYTRGGTFTPVVTEREQCSGSACTGYSRSVGSFLVRAAAAPSQAGATANITASTTPFTTTFTVLNPVSGYYYTIAYGDGSTGVFPATAAPTLQKTYATAGSFSAVITEKACSTASCSASTRTVATFAITASAPPTAYSQGYYQGGYYSQGGYGDSGGN